MASFAFWVVELNFSLSSHVAQENELLEHHQQNLLEHHAESIRDLLGNLYQNARIISLLPAIRDVQGDNRHAVHENVVQQGRLSIDTHWMLQQVYANLAAYVRLSEIYYVLDGFSPEKVKCRFLCMTTQPVTGSPWCQLRTNPKPCPMKMNKLNMQK
ncbi:MAG: hypothetical protein IPH35_07345 [Rhodoferax sp.]|nr:hypothetical protein [Rhodoferax sp.]